MTLFSGGRYFQIPNLVCNCKEVSLIQRYIWGKHNAFIAFVFVDDGKVSLSLTCYIEPPCLFNPAICLPKSFIRVPSVYKRGSLLSDGHYSGGGGRGSVTIWFPWQPLKIDDTFGGRYVRNSMFYGYWQLMVTKLWPSNNPHRIRSVTRHLGQVKIGFFSSELLSKRRRTVLVVCYFYWVLFFGLQPEPRLLWPLQMKQKCARFTLLNWTQVKHLEYHIIETRSSRETMV